MGSAGTRRCLARRLPAWVEATSQPAAAQAPAAASLKQRIKQLAGSKAGHDLSSAGRQQVEAAVQELVDAVPPPSSPSLEAWRSTTWELVYTNSTRNSSGKLGPFIAEVTQEFTGQLGQYYNVPRLGLVSARLEAAASIAESDPQRVVVQFVRVDLLLGPLKIVGKEFPQNMRGYWQCSWTDDDFRVFTTNQGNLFVLAKRQAA